jgi:Mg/Co/Ni transporter MgtE
MLKYQIEGLPVIDDNKHILGVVSINELSEWILEKI